ncbi:MAG: T9SS type A sorting domain-containing protein, partial [Ignavibacteria bacterium]|nr:T9SS type A sorting domain-containing protein [Ignavibacteria bacterium]
EAYILLFFRFNDGWVRVGRRDMNTPTSWSYYTIVEENVLDFAVDRNYSFSNYRAICVYDSSNRIYSTRSEPTSYGTVWQDKVHINGLVGRDLDFAYGWNGAVYTTFNGNSTGNLYVIENTNYADPTGWGSQYIVAQGNADTTRHAEIIASRENYPNNKVIVVFEKKTSPTINTYDLYDATRENNVWTAYNTWVIPDENKYPSMSVEFSNSIPQDFRAAFVQSPELNLFPREIKFKGYNGTIWSQSLQISDPTGDATGLQKPEVGSLGTGATIIAYAGPNASGVYFDREDWVNNTNSTGNKLPDSYALSQNYPNPFNPSTTIQFSVPELSNVNIKVYNLIGQEIAVLVNEQLQSGNYEVRFNAANMPSGVYFYRFQTDNFVETKKMLLTK